MGDIAAKFQEANARITAEEEEVNKLVKPNEVEQPHEYLEYEHKKRRVFTTTNFHTRIYNQLKAAEFSPQQVFNAYRIALKGGDLEKAKGEMMSSSSKFAFKIGTKIRTVGFQIPTQYFVGVGSDPKVTYEVVKLALAAGAITREDVDAALVDSVLEAFAKLPGGADTALFLDTLEADMTDETKKKVMDEIEGSMDNFADEMKDPVTYPYQERCAEGIHAGGSAAG